MRGALFFSGAASVYIACAGLVLDRHRPDGGGKKARRGPGRAFAPSERAAALYLRCLDTVKVGKWASGPLGVVADLARRLPADDGLRGDLEMTGWRGGVPAFRSLQLGVGIAVGFLGSLASLVSATVGGALGLRESLFATLAMGCSLAIAAEVLVKKRAADLRDRIEAQIADAADLVCVAVSSGESVRSALAVATTYCDGPLANELERVVARVASGEPLAQALADMERRVQRTGVAVFAGVLGQAHNRGTALASRLRALSKELRYQRTSKMVETMGRRQVLMIAPVVFLVLPTTLAFAALPGLYYLRLVAG